MFPSPCELFLMALFSVRRLYITTGLDEGGVDNADLFTFPTPPFLLHAGWCDHLFPSRLGIPTTD